jgi:pyruvate dehydrogenase E1 component alpha subunit
MVTVVTPSEDVVQVIREDGSAVAHLEPKLSSQEHERLLRTMMLARATDTKAMNLQRSGRIGFYVPSFGQEACQVGSASALARDDWVAPAYREPGAALYRGAPVSALLAQCYGNTADGQKGRQMPSHFGSREINVITPSSPVGTQIVYATGVAWAMKIQKAPKVALVYFGDGATSEGDFHVGLNFGGVFRVPCIYFCNNNGWAISVPRERQTASKTIAVKAVAYGIEGARCDGNDVLAVVRTTREAVARARGGAGPTLIEALTYRMGPHSSSDDPTRYRPPGELEAWKRKDPIERYRKFLDRNGMVPGSKAKDLEKEVTKEVEDAVVEVESAAPVGPDTIFEDVYAELPYHLRLQRDALLGERKKGSVVEYEQAEGKFPL